MTCINILIQIKQNLNPLSVLSHTPPFPDSFSKVILKYKKHLYHLLLIFNKFFHLRSIDTFIYLTLCNNQHPLLSFWGSSNSFLSIIQLQNCNSLVLKCLDGDHTAAKILPILGNNFLSNSLNKISHSPLITKSSMKRVFFLN